MTKSDNAPALDGDSFNWREFFEEHRDYTVASGFYENRRHFSLEQLYQAFKARLADEQREAEEEIPW